VSTGEDAATESERRREERAEQEFDYDRTVALSDGVFAIAITLLVLSIEIPDPGPDQPPVGELLGSQWREILSYAISVAVIGFLWMRHHTFFRELTRIDTRLIGLNVGYLGLIAFLPFPTELVGENVEEPDAVVLYAATIAVISAVAAGMRFHADRRGLLTEEARREPLWSLALVPAVFLTSIPIAFASTIAAQVWWVVLLLTHRVRTSSAA
jgi:uncharacterized membrane protein